MTDKELKKLSRAELLEMLIALSRENEALKEQIDEQWQQIEDKNIAINSAGSIAEASLKVNGVFEAAQAAAEQYLFNVRNQEQICRGMQSEAEAKAARTVAEAEAKAAQLTAEAEEKAAKTLQDAEDKAKLLTARAQAEASTYWDTVSKRLESFYEEHQSLKSMLNLADRNK